MEKVYIEAQYRIRDRVINTGYICIDGDNIKCLFSLDYSYIKIIDGRIHFYLEEYEPENGFYYECEEFIGGNNITSLKSPFTYILENDSGIILSLELIKEVYNHCLINVIKKGFQNTFGK